MKTSNTEVAEVSKAEAPEYVDGIAALVRSAIPGTTEYNAYRASLEQIDAMARRLMGRKDAEADAEWLDMREGE